MDFTTRKNLMSSLRRPLITLRQNRAKKGAVFRSKPPDHPIRSCRRRRSSNGMIENNAIFCLSPSSQAGVIPVLVQIFESRQTEPIFNFSLRGKHSFPYPQDHGSQVGDLRCVELSF